MRITGAATSLVYETGTWSPSEDVASYVISFSNTHSFAPMYYMIEDTLGSYDSTTYTNYGVYYADHWQTTGKAAYAASSTSWYGRVVCFARTTNTSSFNASSIALTTSSADDSNTATTNPRYWATETGIKAYANSTDRYWRTGHTYKWIAAWNPLLS